MSNLHSISSKNKAKENRAKAKSEYNPIIKSRENHTSRARAIKAMCAHCMGCTTDRIEPGWLNEVRNCSAPHCPLYNFRPGVDHAL